MFERRLGLFPTFFDKDGEMYVYTGFGDFPFKVPNRKISSPQELFPNWMLLSYNKPVAVSSELTGYPKGYAADEDVRSYWTAATGNKGEWLTIDLQHRSMVNAVQVNYAEHNSNLYGRDADIYYQYLLEYSSDNRVWKTLVDKTKNRLDVPHDYVELKMPVQARYLRITNYHVPGGNFALAGLRVFGIAPGKAPAAVQQLNASRNAGDRTMIKLKWKESPDAIGYNVRYGVAKDKLYQVYQVLGANTVAINSLSSSSKYYFTIDAFNESGVTNGNNIIEIY
jgi:hypothetical protein